MIKVHNPHPFAFDGIPARSEGLFHGDAARARKFGLVVLEEEPEPDPTPEKPRRGRPPKTAPEPSEE